MSKTYTVPCSSITAYRGGTNTYKLPTWSSPEDYRAGNTASYRYGVICKFDGLSDIPSDATVSKVTLHLKRVHPASSGTDMTYAVNMDYAFFA